MGKEILVFGNIEIEKKIFCCHITPFFGRRRLVYNKISFGEKYYKYFLDYLYNGNTVKLLNIMLRKTTAYLKRYDGQTKWMYFLIDDDDLV